MRKCFDLETNAPKFYHQNYMENSQGKTNVVSGAYKEINERLSKELVKLKTEPFLTSELLTSSASVLSSGLKKISFHITYL